MDIGARLSPATKIPEPPANRRKPRMYATVDTTPSPETPYTLDFCQWLQSEEFDQNRLRHIVGSGGTWLGSKITW